LKKYNIQKQHDKGKYHAIERIILLLDQGSFHEIGSGIVNYGYYFEGDQQLIDYDGVITGYGKINGKNVFVYAQDFSVCGGSLGLRHGRKIAHIIKLAINAKSPVIGIYDSGGARIEEGVNALAGCGEMMYYNTLASGYIPQISVIAGPCAGASAYSPALTDFVYMIDKVGCMFITGADVVKSVTGEVCTLQELGGAKVHGETTGVSHFRYRKEKECFSSVRKLIDFLPSSCMDEPKINGCSYQEKDNSGISSLLPSESKKVYDMKGIINEMVDQDSFIEVQEEFAGSIIVGFAKISDITIGIIANQPQINCGSIDLDSSDKAARFVRFCDSFHIPIVTLVDTPGYLPGKIQEHSGIIRHGAKLLYAYSEASVPKLTVIIRKAYGGAYIAMGSKHTGADYVYAWPDSEIAVMGAESAVSILCKKELAAMDKEESADYIREQADKYAAKHRNADIAVFEGYVDEIIEPHKMRYRLFHDLISLASKTDTTKLMKKHGNIPL
jgi:acetyl-CoA carboxylase carboxyltransferase component